jgi:tetratricopeptide (TPR) repeat protein
MSLKVAYIRLHARPVWICLAVCLAPVARSATLEGIVRDSSGHPVGAANVYLQSKATGESQTTHSDAGGSYRFSGLRSGAYLLRLQAGTSRPITLADGEAKKIDLTVEYAFFDEPNFIVAGVTDPISRGGHGSDTVQRSTEALAKAAAALREEPDQGPAAAEKRGDPLTAVREYQRAAELEPSEPNLFNWGAELLKHRAAEPATEVFAKGHRLFPRSTRLLLGLAAAWYACSDYDRAARLFFEACDLNPSDPAPYMFLGKVQSIEFAKMPGYVERLERFAKLHPDDAWANYYYAAGLWNQRKGPEDAGTPARVRELLHKAVHLDPSLGAAYLLLGIVFADQNDDARAIDAYQKSILVSPWMDEPHYRLGQAYERTGKKEKARQELEAYEQLSRTSQQEAERERKEIQQFVFEMGDSKTRH